MLGLSVLGCHMRKENMPSPFSNLTLHTREELKLVVFWLVVELSVYPKGTI